MTADRECKTLDAMTTDFSIIDILRKHCDASCAATLMKELRRSRMFDGGSGEVSFQTLRERFDQFLTLCSVRLPNRILCGILIETGTFFVTRGDLITGGEMYARVIDRAERVGERSLLAEAYLRRSEVYCKQGYWRKSAADLSKSRKLFRVLDKVCDLARVENTLGTNLAEQGKMKEAQQYLKRALDTFSKANEKTWEGLVLMNLGIVYNILGQHDTALVQYQRARACFEQVGNIPKLAMLHHNLGMTYLHKSKSEHSITEFDESFRLATESMDIGLIGLSRLGKAHAAHYQRDYSFSLQLVNEALRCFESCNDRLSIADAYKVKGMVYRELGRFDAAEIYFQTSLRINSELHNILNTGETSYELGVLDERRNRRPSARKHFDYALECFSKVGALNQVALTEHQLNRCGKRSK